jgi:hypothetical protein
VRRELLRRIWTSCSLEKIEKPKKITFLSPKWVSEVYQSSHNASVIFIAKGEKVGGREAERVTENVA